MQNEAMEPILVSVKRGAALLGLGKTKTFELISDGYLDSVSAGRKRLITMASIRRFAKEGTAS